MATQDDEKDEREDSAEEADAADASSELDAENAEASASEPGAPEVSGESEGATAIQMGAQKYVHAAFFVAGILCAYLGGKVLNLIWNQLADWPAAVRAVPQLVNYAEEQRDSITLVGGALIGVLVVIQSYRKENIRRWANEVATELSKVTWPNREAVFNGTLVVVIASAIATVYVAILDRLWGFLSQMVYGA
jgi:preprotein translocase subunit SecE